MTEPEPSRDPRGPADKIASNWAESKDHEVGFWRHWITTGGDHWPNEFAERTDPETPLQSFLVGLLDPASDFVRILDAGAGPLTCVGKIWPGHEVELLAVDALADAYDTLLAASGIEPLVRTQSCETERLRQKFPASHFDLCYVRNALDHGYDPIAGIRQLLEVVKPGCCVVLQHFVNEGEKAKYHDIHQWNISIENEDMIIWNPNVRHSVSAEIQDVAEIASTESDGEFTTVVLRRKP